MFGLSLKKLIEPHNSLLEYFKPSLNSFLPQYKYNIIIDDELNFEIEKELPRCSINIYFKLDRITDVIDKQAYIATPLIHSICTISNKLEKSKFKLEDIFDDFKISDLFSNIYSDRLFNEFYTLNNVLDEWHITTENYTLNTYRTYKNRDQKQPLVCPVEVKFEENEFKLYPAIIRYKDVKEGLTKRYDFCVFLAYKFKKEEFYDDDYDRYWINYGDFTLKCDNKKIIRKMRLADSLDLNEEDRIDIFQSTELDKEGFYLDICFNEVNEIIINYVANALKKATIDKSSINLIERTFQFYKKLINK